MHLEDQFLVHNGVYTDINNDQWVKCSKSLTPYHIKCLQENVYPFTNMFIPLCLVISDSVLVLLLKILFWFYSVTMGQQGTNHLKKKCSPSPPAQRQQESQSHCGQQLNTWSEMDMAMAINEYHGLVLCFTSTSPVSFI